MLDRRLLLIEGLTLVPSRQARAILFVLVLELRRIRAELFNLFRELFPLLFLLRNLRGHQDF
jgi:hypothetical protein